MSLDLPDETSAPPWWKRGVVPTNAELTEWLRVTSPDNREWWLSRVKKQSEAAARCWEHDHASLQERLNDAYDRLREANARIDWLERNYVEARPA